MTESQIDGRSCFLRRKELLIESSKGGVEVITELVGLLEHEYEQV